MTTHSTLPPARSLPWLFRDEAQVVETHSLWLRWPNQADAVALQAIAGIQAVAEMTASWPHPLPDGEAARRIARMRAANEAGASAAFALVLKSDPRRLVGTIGSGVRTDDTLDLGYMLDPELHNRGFVTEAVRGLVRELFIHTRFDRIRASCRTVNPASRRVLEKSGFDKTGSHHLDTPARGSIEVNAFELRRGDWLASPDGAWLRRALDARRPRKPPAGSSVECRRASSA